MINTKQKLVVIVIGAVILNISAWMAVGTQNAQASTEVFGVPSALDYYSYPTLYGVQYPVEAKVFWGDHAEYDYAIMQNPIDDEWLATGLYNSSAWYHPSADPPSFPPDNATIEQVWMYADVALNTYGTRTFYLQYAINDSKANISGGTAVWHTGDPTQGGYPSSDIVKTVTSIWPNYVAYTTEITGNESWNASMLRDNIWVRIYSGDHTSTRLYVDYVGIFCTWTPAIPPPPEEEEEDEAEDAGMFGLGSVVTLNALFGFIGFCGMIAVPAVSVWFWRKEGGSKLAAFVTGLTTFMFSLTLFLGSLG